MAAPLVNLAANLTVSKLCLGTMTFGEQNSSPESLQLLGGAVEAGINFFDSAEMYPVVQLAETQGRSEEYPGRWIRESKTIHHRFGHQAMFPCLGKQNMIQRGSFVQFLWRDNWILLGELLIRICWSQ
nr:uncharacterized protein LOC103427430 [Malus domestica]